MKRKAPTKCSDEGESSHEKRSRISGLPYDLNAPPCNRITPEIVARFEGIMAKEKEKEKEKEANLVKTSCVACGGAKDKCSCATSTKSSIGSKEEKKAPSTSLVFSPFFLALFGICLICVVKVRVGARPRGYAWGKCADFENCDVTSGSRSGSAVSPFYLQVEVALMGGKWLLREEVPNDEVWNTLHKRTIPFEHAWQGPKVFTELGHWDEKNQRPTEKYWSDRTLIFFAQGKSASKPDKGNRRPKIIEKWITAHRRKCDVCKGISKLRKQYKVEKKDTPLPDCPDMIKPIGHWFNGKLLGLVPSRLTIYWPIYTRLIATVPYFVAAKADVARGKHTMVLDFDGPRTNLFPQGREVTAEMLYEVAHGGPPMGHGYVFAAALLNLGRPSL